MLFYLALKVIIKSNDHTLVISPSCHCHGHVTMRLTEMGKLL